MSIHPDDVQKLTGTFDLPIRPVKARHLCHPERSEGSRAGTRIAGRAARSFATLRTTRLPENLMAKHVDYYVSLNSPWTYLASKRFEAIAKKHGADVTI